METEMEMNTKMEVKEMVYATHTCMSVVPVSSHLSSHSAASYQLLAVLVEELWSIQRAMTLRLWAPPDSATTICQ